MNSDRIRLVATDLDGTLLGADSFITDATANTLAAVAERGIALVACTGRGQYSGRRRLEPVPAMRYAVFSNGSVVWDRAIDQPVRWSSFADQAWRELLNWLERELPGAGFAWETRDGLVTDQRWHELFDIADSRWTPQDPAAATEAVKILVKDPDSTAKDLSATVAAADLDVEVSTAGLDFVEITAAGVDKAHGLSWVCEQLGVDAADTVAFGDEVNDLPMFAWVGHAVAMENAAEPVRAAADDHAGHHADDGVSAYLAHHLNLP